MTSLPKFTATDRATGTPAPDLRTAREQVEGRLSVAARSQRVSGRHLLRATLRGLVLLAVDGLTVGSFLAVCDQLRSAPALIGRFAALLAAGAPGGGTPVVQAVVGVLLGLVALGNFGPGDARRDSARLLAGTYLGFALPYWPYLWQENTFTAVVGYVLVSFVVGVLLLLERHAVDWLIYRFRPVGADAARTMVIGTRLDMRHAAANPALSDRRTFRFCARFDAKQYAAAGGSSLQDALYRSIRRHRIDTILLAAPLDDATFSAVVSAAGVSGCAILSLARSFVLGALEPSVIWLRGTPIVRLNRPSLVAWQLIVKRTVDIAVASVGLLLLAPLLAVVALAVKVTSPGPVLFRQARVGLGGRHFRILKFRSMVADAEERRRNLVARSLYKDARLFKVKNDPRVTPLGAFLRRTSLDELPQLWNVLVGDMSLVGPRPPLPSEVELYEAHHYARFEVKPGITGPWQVSGRNRLTDFEAVIGLETAYIRDWNVWKDLAILLRTVPAVLTGRGAH